MAIQCYLKVRNPAECFVAEKPYRVPDLEEVSTCFMTL